MTCLVRCEHGGVCELEEGHEGLHDTGYCRYTDDEAVSVEEGDAIFAAKLAALKP